MQKHPCTYPATGRDPDLRIVRMHRPNGVNKLAEQLLLLVQE
jgi:hypothetical protein